MAKFRDIVVFPSYGRHASTVAWMVDPSIRDAEFYVYRSFDMNGDYELLNEEPVFGNIYTDTTFYTPNKLQIPVYRLLAIIDGKEYESPEVALYAKTGRKAYGVAHSIIRSKYLQARQDGLPVLYYPLVRNGKTNSAMDPDTGQRTKAVCSSPDREPGDDDYGTRYAGGYCRPYLTYVRLLGETAQKENILDVGVFDTSVMMAETLAFPFPRTDDMLVDVYTDRRWKIGDTIQTHMVKGVIPIGHTVKISLQSHNDPCYSVPVPDNYYDLVKEVAWQKSTT